MILKFLIYFSICFFCLLSTFCKRTNFPNLFNAHTISNNSGHVLKKLGFNSISSFFAGLYIKIITHLIIKKERLST